MPTIKTHSFNGQEIIEVAKTMVEVYLVSIDL